MSDKKFFLCFLASQQLFSDDESSDLDDDDIVYILKQKSGNCEKHYFKI